MNKFDEIELTDEELLDKAINGEKLDEEEWRQIVTGYAWDNEIDTVYGDEGRWTRSCTIIFPYKGKNYGINYEVGLTECQENDYSYCSIGEVRKVVKTIEDWEFV